LPLHGGQSGIGAAALGGFLDRGVDLAKAPVEIGDLVGLDVDLGSQRRVLRLDGRRRRPAVAHMGSDKLGVHARGVDDGEPKDEGHEGGPPDQCGCAPPPGKPAGRHQLGSLHGDRHGDHRHGRAWKEHHHAADAEPRRSTGEGYRGRVGSEVAGRTVTPGRPL
jgi:hypothetical protein